MDFLDDSHDGFGRWIDVHKLDGDRPREYRELIVDHSHERAEALRRYEEIGSVARTS